MTDLELILPLWRELETAAEDYVLATVVEVQGSSYRKPGACMLVAADGRRAGTVSGGCLEAEVARRAWWFTADGPIIQRYSTAEEDGELPYGSGCGGVLHLLLERRSTAAPLLTALGQAFDQRIPIAVATILEGPQFGRRAFAGLTHGPSEDLPPAIDRLQTVDALLQALAERTLPRHNSVEQRISIHGTETRVWINFRPARPGLWIFGAGDNAQPLLNMARELGWFVAIADGRSQLVNRDHFPSADELHVLPIKELPGDQSAGQPSSLPKALAHLHPTDAAVIMTHSFEQDARILAALLSLETPLAYIGVLGPQRRTRELLAKSARLLNLSATAASAIDGQIERWLAALHSPTGLDLGAESPETIALSVLAEIQQSLTAATALPLRQVRAAALTSSS